MIRKLPPALLFATTQIFAIAVPACAPGRRRASWFAAGDSRDPRRRPCVCRARQRAVAARPLGNRLALQPPRGTEVRRLRPRRQGRFGRAELRAYHLRPPRSQERVHSRQGPYSLFAAAGRRKGPCWCGRMPTIRGACRARSNTRPPRRMRSISRFAAGVIDQNCSARGSTPSFSLPTT